MRKLASILLLLLLTGCSTGVTTHDQVRAAELVVDFLSSLKTEQGIEMAYDWTDDEYKKQVPPAEFTRLIASIRAQNSGADIRLAGYENFGAREILVVHANSETADGILHFRFSLAGTKHKDYYLLDLGVSNQAFTIKGVYAEFARSIIIQGV